MTKQPRLTATGLGNIVPDKLVSDLFEAGWRMVKWHKVDEQYRPIMPGEVVATTMPQSVYSMSNIFARMETGEQIIVDDDKIYRVDLGRSDKILVTCYGIDSIDSVLKPYYNSVNDLPDWVQKRLSVLMLLDPDKTNNDVAKVGRRINRTVFWIYPEQ